jgi:hypothetical protein
VGQTESGRHGNRRRNYSQRNARFVFTAARAPRGCWRRPVNAARGPAGGLRACKGAFQPYRLTCLFAVTRRGDAVPTGSVNIPISYRAYKMRMFEYAFIRQLIVVLIFVSNATVLAVPYAVIYASASDVPGVFLRVCLINAMMSAIPVREKASNRDC